MKMIKSLKRLKKFDASSGTSEFIEKMRKTTYVQKTYKYAGAFYLNENELEDGVRYFFDGLSSFTIPNFQSVLKRIGSCEWVQHSGN